MSADDNSLCINITSHIDSAELSLEARPGRLCFMKQFRCIFDNQLS